MDPEKGLPTTTADVNGTKTPEQKEKGSEEEQQEGGGVQWPTYDRKDVQRVVDRFLGRGRPHIGYITGLRKMLFGSCELDQNLRSCF